MRPPTLQWGTVWWCHPERDLPRLTRSFVALQPAPSRGGPCGGGGIPNATSPGLHAPSSRSSLPPREGDRVVVVDPNATSPGLRAPSSRSSLPPREGDRVVVVDPERYLPRLTRSFVALQPAPSRGGPYAVVASRTRPPPAYTLLRRAPACPLERGTVWWWWHPERDLPRLTRSFVALQPAPSRGGPYGGGGIPNATSPGLHAPSSRSSLPPREGDRVVVVDPNATSPGLHAPSSRSSLPPPEGDRVVVVDPNATSPGLRAPSSRSSLPPPEGDRVVVASRRYLPRLPPIIRVSLPPQEGDRMRWWHPERNLPPRGTVRRRGGTVWWWLPGRKTIQTKFLILNS